MRLLRSFSDCKIDQFVIAFKTEVYLAFWTIINAPAHHMSASITKSGQKKIHKTTLDDNSQIKKSAKIQPIVAEY